MGSGTPGATGSETDAHHASQARGLSIHSLTQRRRYLVILAGLAVVLLLCVYPLLAQPSHGGSSDLHFTIESVGGLIGLLAGFALIARFYALGNRFHLLIGLGFFLSGATDLVHGILSLNQTHRWVESLASSLAGLAPEVNVCGRLLLGSILILAPFMPKWLGPSRSPKQEAKWGVLLIIALVILAGAIELHLPLAKLTYAGRAISRPLDFAAAMVLLGALCVFVNEYQLRGDMLTWWIALSICVNVAGQVMLAFSRMPYDAFFGIAHLYRVLGHAAPLLGFCLHEISVVTERERAQAHISHLNAVLRAIGTVHEVIPREKNRDRLLQACCDRLVGTKGYFSAWVVLLDENGKVETGMQAGLGEAFDGLLEVGENRDLPYCTRMASDRDEVVVVTDTGQTCEACPLSRSYPERATMAVGLRQDGRVYGTLAVSLPKAVAEDADEKLLLAKVGHDIAFALHRLELEEDRRQAQEALQEAHDRLEHLVEARTAALRESNQALRQSMERLATLHEVDDAILTARSVAEVGEAALEHFQILIPCCYASVVTFDSETGQGRVAAVCSTAENHPRSGELVPVEASDVPETSSPAEIRVIEDLQAGSSPSAAEQSLLREGVRSLVTVPLVAEGTVVGALNLGFSVAGPFRSEHRDIVVEVAEVLAVAISQSHLHDELRRHAAALEQRVAERTRELEQSNRDLEAFAYSVSHDLRVPLTALKGFATMLRDAHLDQVDAEGKRFLDLVIMGTDRMMDYVKKLLDFSRAGRGDLTPVDIDMTELVGASFAELAAAVPDTRPRLEVAGLPPSRGDATMIRQALTNLLSNAIKFTGGAEDPFIEVGGSAAEAENVYYVRDNGVGFDPEHGEKMFKVFERLHDPEEFEGTGVGLATVRRIIDRHGGRVWAEGAVNEGSTFMFTLPNGGGRDASRPAESP